MTTPPPVPGLDMAAPAPPPPWAPLRDELRLSPGPVTEFGAPSWTLHDPAGHKFYRLGWLEFEVLSRWHLASTEKVLAAIKSETTLSPSESSVQAVYDFALRNSLLISYTPQDTARLIQLKKMSKTSLSHKILHGYLFLRIPLLAPDTWLKKNLSLVSWMFTKKFLTALIILSLLAIYLISRDWVNFILDLGSLWSWQQGILALLSLALAKTMHELGHAFAAKHLGLRVPRMGVALMCFAPVLWTDVTESWKLPRRSDRLLIDMSGVGAELILATIASLIWALLPPGEAKSAMLTLAGVTWLATLAVNANPFMRYDGYYILSDYWEVPGLQQRSFALAQWRLREMVFGFGDPPPEALPKFNRNKLIIYAYATWLYRFFLFWGIALLVYHLFFKALGLGLMMVELIWFIGRPIYKELKHWYSRRKEINLNWQSLRSAALVIILLILFVVPWHTSVKGAGLLTAWRYASFYTPYPSQVESIKVQPGQEVSGGQTLMILKSPDLDAQIKITKNKLETLKRKIAAASLDPELHYTYAIDKQELQMVASELEAYQQEKTRLTIKAPFEGTFQDLPYWMVPGAWVPDKTKVGLVTSSGGLLTAYVAEEDIERLEKNMHGIFYPNSGFFKPLKVEIIAIEQSATRDIPQLELPTTSPGGIIPAKKISSGLVVPEQALYKVTCRAESANQVPAQSLTGHIFFEGKRRSYAVRFWNAAIGLLIRESSLN